MCLVRQCKIGYVALLECCFGRADWSLKDVSCKTM